MVYQWKCARNGLLEEKVEEWYKEYRKNLSPEQQHAEELKDRLSGSILIEGVVLTKVWVDRGAGEQRLE